MHEMICFKGCFNDNHDCVEALLNTVDYLNNVEHLNLLIHIGN